MELNVADNSIAELPGSLARLPRLKQLTVYGNRLSELAQELIRMPSLKGALLLGFRGFKKRV